MSVGAWTNVTTGSQPANGWTTFASSFTGQYCIAGNTDTNLYTSSDYGQNWAVTTGTNAPTNSYWRYVAITQDGNRMAACIGEAGTPPATIYLLDKNGTNANRWINIIPNNTQSPTNPGTANNWFSIAFSVDGNTLAGSAISTIWLYNITTSTWSNPPPVTNLTGNSFPPLGGNVSSNSKGFIFATPSNSLYTVYNNGSGGYISSVWTIGNTKIDSGPYDGFPWSAISSSLDGNTLVLCYSTDGASPTGKIYIGTFVQIPPANPQFTGDQTLQLITQSGAGVANWNVVAMGPDAVSIAASSANTSDGPRGKILVGNKSYGSTTYSWVEQTYLGAPLNSDWYGISRSTDPSQFTKFVTGPRSPSGSDKTGIWIFTSTESANQAQEPPPIICFKEDSKILTDKGYVAVQNLRRGDLVKTLRNGFVAIHSIGRKDIYNPSLKERIKDQLYKCSSTEYPEVFEDLIITGCHSILVDNYTDEEQRQKTIEVNGNAYVTDKKYRLPACADSRASIYENQGAHTIYHLALEHDDYYMNYGIYANGLLVETCSQRYLKELSDMTLIE